MLKFATSVIVCPVPPGEDKKPVISGQRRKRASSASAAAVPATVSSDGRADNADTPNIRPIHFNVPPLLDIPRFGDPNVGERSSTPHWDGQPNLASLEARLVAQNEAIWNRVRMLNEQVCVVGKPRSANLVSCVPVTLHRLCIEY